MTREEVELAGYRNKRTRALEHSNTTGVRWWRSGNSRLFECEPRLSANIYMLDPSYPSMSSHARASIFSHAKGLHTVVRWMRIPSHVVICNKTKQDTF